jgi:hypothetical protein
LFWKFFSTLWAFHHSAGSESGLVAAGACERPTIHNVKSEATFGAIIDSGHHRSTQQRYSNPLFIARAEYCLDILDRVLVMFRKGENKQVFTKQKQNNDPYLNGWLMYYE